MSLTDLLLALKHLPNYDYNTPGAGTIVASIDLQHNNWDEKWHQNLQYQKEKKKH